MNKSAIKTFATESRKKLISEIKHKTIRLGITAEGIADPVKKAEGMEIYSIGGGNSHTIYDEAIEQRKDLVKQVNEKGFDNVIEEVAYTWFNRIIAIRFMEVNDYIPTRIRVLSSETRDKTEPDIVTEAPDVDLGLFDEEKEQIYQLKSENKLDELFRLLFIKQCNNLNKILPELFEKTADYTELLLSISFTNKDGVIRQLVDNISEEDFKDQVEIIGWLYQYYNTELKEETFKLAKKGVKISKERIPAATQLFTPDWIVRYMVENSLGRLWLEGHPDSDLKENWKYYLDEAEQELEVQIKLAKIKEDFKNTKPEDIKIIDPAIGSGHIIIRAFDILMQIYTSVGYTERDAAISILDNNLYGLDIDDRAYQLAFFAVMMKARAYNRTILKKAVKPQIYAIQESNEIREEVIDFIADGDANIGKNLKYLVEIFVDAKNYGSIINVDQIDFNSILDSLAKVSDTKFKDFKSIEYQKEAINNVYPLLKQAIILSMKYDVVVTNPPYLGNSNMNKDLLNYLKKNFPDSKKDLFAVFIDKCLTMLSEKGYLAKITQHSFMFLSSYEKLREKILEKNIVNMIHLGARAFEEIGGEVVQTTSFILQNNFIRNHNSIYLRLVDYNSQHAKETAFLNRSDIYVAKQENFTKIPGRPIAYWASENFINAFEKGILLGDVVETRLGMATADNTRFTRLWYELDINNCGFDKFSREEAKSCEKRWFPYNKGGSYRKWYGNNEYMVDWENDGFSIRNFKNEKTGKIRSHNYNLDFIFKEGLTWTFISANLGVRYSPKGFLFDSAGSSMFMERSLLNYILAFLSSKVAFEFLKIINPTLNAQPGSLSSFPLLLADDIVLKKIDDIVIENINISKNDWDNFETSWNFLKHPLLLSKDENINSIELSFINWENNSFNQFNKIKKNEELLNKVFIEIYGLQTEVNPKIGDKDITINKANLLRDIKSFISYAVGCMFGRYSLEEEGLIFAGGQWDPSKYTKFIPDADNIIPILDAEYFEDDIVGRFVEFVKVTFGEDTLEENLDFIASALKKKGNTSREVIRNYFLTDFCKDHYNLYSSKVTGKCPIYWQFDSGKNNGFKALIYMHRYESDIVARVRTNYLHKTQKALETAREHKERIIENSTSSSEKSKAVKARDRLIKQLEEMRKYDEALAHVANQRIEINLNYGVKVNYAKFQGIEVSREGKKATKIDLLKKI